MTYSQCTNKNFTLTLPLYIFVVMCIILGLDMDYTPVELVDNIWFKQAPYGDDYQCVRLDSVVIW